MARSARRAQPQLSDSWAAVGDDDDYAPSGSSISSEEDYQQPAYATDVDLSSSQTSHLQEALGSPRRDLEAGSRRAPVPASPRSNRRPLRNPLTKSELTPSGSSARSPRQRMTRSSIQDREPELVMPMPSTEDRGAGQASAYTSRSPTDQSTSRQRNRVSAQGSNRRTKPQPGSVSNTPRQPGNTSNLLWTHVLLPILDMAASVLRIAMTFLKPLLTYGLAIWLLFGLLLMARNFLFSSVSDALAPLCHLPGSSYLPFCASPTSVSPAGPVEFDRLISAQSAFEDVLTTSAGGASLPLAMKHSEGSIRDLRQVVQYSNLPSRHELVFEFSGFIETARQASSDLTRYNARIGGAVDRILSTNRWTLQVLDGISASEAQTGALRKFASSHLNILAPFQAPRKLAHEMLLEQYLRHTSAVEEQITSLILEAQALLQILQNLDDRLDLIANIATRDGVAVEGDRDKLFAHLFTKLGGNRKNVAKLDAQLRLLRDVGTYKRLAWAHVSGTIVKLQAIAANLEDLRERVAAPEVVGINNEAGLTLEGHVRVILMGVERLEKVREEGRRIEGQRVRSILDKAEGMGIEGP